MTFTTEWTTELRNPIYMGLDPTVDPFEPESFFIADGWGSYYSSMKLRKIRFQDGQEISSAYIKNSTRCLHFDPNGEKLMAVSDSRWFSIFRKNLEVEAKYEDKMAKYCDYISSDNSGKFLAMNYRAGNLFIFDVRNGTGKKKKIGSCNGIVPFADSRFLVFLPFEGKVVLFDLNKEKVVQEFEFSTFKQAILSTSGKVYLRLGKQHLQENTSFFIDPLDKLVIYDGLESKSGADIVLPGKVERFYLNDKEDKIYLCQKDRVLELSVSSGKVTGEIAFEGGFHIIKFFVNESKALLGKYEDKYKTISLVNIKSEA